MRCGKVVEDVEGSDETKSFSPQLATFPFCLFLTSLLHTVLLHSLSVVMGLKTLQEIETRNLDVMDAF
jgi:hypothetical protein